MELIEDDTLKCWTEFFWVHANQAFYELNFLKQQLTTRTLLKG